MTSFKLSAIHLDTPHQKMNKTIFTIQSVTIRVHQLCVKIPAFIFGVVHNCLITEILLIQMF